MQTSGFNMFVEGGRGTRVGSDGSGLTNVWRQQLMQFKNVSVEVSNAIIAQYPSPRLLHDVRIELSTCNSFLSSNNNPTIFDLPFVSSSTLHSKF